MAAQEFFPLPPLVMDSADLSSILAAGGGHPALDLAQGAYAPEGNVGMTILRQVAAVVGVGIGLYTTILGADTLAIAHLADRRAAEAAKLYAEIVPPDKSSGDISADIQTLEINAQAPHGAFLPLMTRISATLKPFSDGLSLDTLSYSADDASVSFGVEVADFAALQRVEDALRKNGVAVDAGAATAASGGVQTKFTLSFAGPS